MDFDLFVIGGGSGGVRAARWSASLGAKVGLCESSRMGGTCVIRGCVPKKLMSYAGKLQKELKVMSYYGWQTQQSSFDWQKLKENRDREIDRISGVYTGLLTGRSVEVFEAHGQVIGPNEVRVGDQTVTAKNILIAVGGRPWLPEIPGIEHAISSDQIFHLTEFPKKLAVVGTGYIGLEFASIFNGMGSEVHLMCRKELPLSGFDKDIKKRVKEQMIQNGVIHHIQKQVAKVSKNGKLTIELNSGELIEDVDQILVATGRRPYTEGLFSDEAKSLVDFKENGAIKVNSLNQTKTASLFAVGDVTDRVNLTPVALEEGTFLAENLFGKKESQQVDYQNIATAVFTSPEVSTIGLSEEQCLQDEQLKDKFQVFESEFRALKYTLMPKEDAPRSYMKMLVHKESGKILGAHMLGDDSAEMMQNMAVAIKAGATKSDFDRTIGIHPTIAEEWTTLRTPRD